MKTLTDKNNKEIIKGSVVRFKDGWQRVSSIAATAQTVNLCGVFSGVIHDKKVPLAEIYEDETAWYENWTKSESYQCM